MSKMTVAFASVLALLVGGSALAETVTTKTSFKGVNLTLPVNYGGSLKVRVTKEISTRTKTTRIAPRPAGSKVNIDYPLVTTFGRQPEVRNRVLNGEGFKLVKVFKESRLLTKPVPTAWTSELVGGLDMRIVFDRPGPNRKRSYPVPTFADGWTVVKKLDRFAK